MGKNVYLPGLALLSGILGLGLRLWQRRVSFDPETLLFLSGCPAPALLLALTAVVAAVLLVSLRREGPPKTAAEVLACPSTLYMTLMAAGALLMLVGGALSVQEGLYQLTVWRVDPAAEPVTYPIALLLCALFGGLISGIGSGMTIRFGGAIDGVEVMAVIFAKGLGLTVGTFVMIYNVLLYIAIGCIFKSWVLPLYSIVTYCVAIKAVDFIVEGLDKAKSAMIVTNQETAISAALSEAFGRGITHIDARGFYSGQEQTIIYFVVNRFQIARLKSIVTSIDPNAFITISDVSDVLGKSVHK